MGSNSVYVLLFLFSIRHIVFKLCLKLSVYALQKRFEDTTGAIRSRRPNDQTIQWQERDERYKQMFYKTLHRKLKFEQYEPNKTAHCDMFDITDIYLF
jgi:hypothetical protein